CRSVVVHLILRFLYSHCATRPRCLMRLLAIFWRKSSGRKRLKSL
ncbi:Indole-3-glycerol phosphate synthase, partial [uncultured Leptolyngbya sp.]